MNGSGCKKCPVNPCEANLYRGSVCAMQREKLGLGDPATIADHVRIYTDDELAKWLALNILNALGLMTDRETLLPHLQKAYLERLQQPAECMKNTEEWPPRGVYGFSMLCAKCKHKRKDPVCDDCLKEKKCGFVPAEEVDDG